MTLLFVYLLLALGVSFYCSVAEAVLLSVSRPYVVALESKGNWAAGLLAKMQDDMSRPLAAILTLNTIAHTVGAAGAGAEAAAIFGSGYVGVVSAVLTLLILFLSEIIPKSLGATYWRLLAPPMAISVRYLVFLVYPLVVVAELLTRWFGKHAPDTFEREELAAMVDIGERQGELDLRESRALRNILRLESIRVRDSMTPRTVMFSVSETMSIGEYFQAHAEIAFSRIPVFENTHDHVTGFVLRSDLLLAQARGELDRKLVDFRRDIRVIPLPSSVAHAFETLLDSREHIALCVDEFGGTAGIITLEDVLETLLGLEIVDEQDATVSMKKKARRQWEERARRMGLGDDES